VLAPAAVNADDAPMQIAAGDAVAVTVGVGLTVTVTLAVLWHPFALTPVIEYVVVAVGVTVMLAPVRLPGIHV